MGYYGGGRGEPGSIQAAYDAEQARKQVPQSVWTADRAAACVAGALYSPEVQAKVDQAMAAATHTDGARERQVPRYEEHKYEDHPEAAHDPCDPKVTGPEVWKPSNTAREILMYAAQIVHGGRADQHGPKERNHANIARFWDAWMHGRLAPDVHFTAHDVATMMELLKIARRKTGEFNLDDYVDGAGYAGIAGEIAANGGKEQL
jgi:hypothetical protein